MDVKELKQQIENQTLGDQFLILKYSDSTFLARQYIQAIADFKHLEVHYVDDLEAAGSILANRLDVCFLDEYTDMMYCDYLTNLIVVCKEVGMCSRSFAVELPKLESWQVEDYVSTQLPGIDTNLIKWLCENAQYNIDRLDLEIQKINIFPKGLQQGVFKQLNEAHNYADLSTLTTYDLVKAVLQKDLNVVKEYYTEQLDVNVLGLITLLIRGFKQVVDVQINPKATPESLGVSYGQFKAIQHNCGHYTNQQLISIYQFLLKLDLRLKSGLIDQSSLKDYVIPHILTEGGI